GGRGGGEALRLGEGVGARRRVRREQRRQGRRHGVLRHARRSDSCRDSDGRRVPRRDDRAHRGPLLLGTRGVPAEGALVRSISGQVARRRAVGQARDPAGLGRDPDRGGDDRGGEAGPRPSPGRREAKREVSMNRWEAWIIRGGFGLAAASGILYGIAKYFLANPDPDSRAGHPWQPVFLAAHVLAAPAAVFAMGLLLRGHVLPRIRRGEREGRRTGLTLLAIGLAPVPPGDLVPVLSRVGAP